MKTKRAGNRSGYLYKVANNKVYPANSPVKGRYWLQIMLNGRRKQIALKDGMGQRITTFKEAQKAQKRLIAPLLIKDEQEILNFVLNALKTQNKPSIGNNDVLLSEAEAKFARIRASENISKYYAERNVSDARNLLKQVTSEQPNKQYVSQITTSDVRNFLSKFQNVSDRTYNCRLSGLTMFFREVMEDFRGDWTNPCGKLKHRSLNLNNQTPKRVLTDEEIRKVLTEAKKVSEELHLLFLLGVYTGLRLSDCCSLKWTEIDLTKKVITKVAQKTKRFSVRPIIVGISEELFIALSSIKDPKNEYLFPYYHQYSDKQPRDRIHTQITKVFKMAGIQTEKITPDGRTVKEVGYHSFRHTFITKHAMLGTPLAVIQESVGHSSAAMTLHYMQIDKNKVAEAAKNYKVL